MSLLSSFFLEFWNSAKKSDQTVFSSDAASLASDIDIFSFFLELWNSAKKSDQTVFSSDAASLASDIDRKA